MLEERKALLQRQHDLGARCQQLESDVQRLHAEVIAEQEKRQSLEDALHCRLVAELDVDVADQQATADAEEMVRLRADVADLQHDKAALQAHMADDKAALARVQRELEEERSAAQALGRHGRPSRARAHQGNRGLQFQRRAAGDKAYLTG